MEDEIDMYSPANSDEYLIVRGEYPKDIQYDQIKIIFAPKCHLKGFVKLDKHTYYNSKLLPCEIRTYHTHHGKLGLFGRLGHKVDDAPVLPDNALSLHAPSVMVIRTNVDYVLYGYISPNVKKCPRMSFRCDNHLIDRLDKAGAKTSGFVIWKGEHTLQIMPSSQSWAHSIWLFEPYNKISNQGNRDDISVKKLFKIDMIERGRGLLNQLISIINGLTVLDGTNRDVVEPPFLPDYRSLESVPLSYVFNMDKFNEILGELGFRIRLVERQEGKPWVKFNYHNRVCSINVISEIHDRLSGENEPYLDIGSMFSITTIKTPHQKDIEFRLYNSLPFNEKYVQIYQWVVDNYLGEKYNLVHFRLEDDFTTPFAVCMKKSPSVYSGLLFDKYVKEMLKLFRKDDKIYLATYLGKAHHANNQYLQKLKNIFPNIIYNVPWRSRFSITEGREIDAIVDFIICKSAERYIGIHGSTFSMVIYDINVSRKKICSLIHPHI